ncbi:MAG: TonB system transport protein ExbD [Rhizomicrobium sp.]
MVRLRHQDDVLKEASDINVTPFIDVMLVMLIIFMVAAPLATVDVKVDLPQSSAAPSLHPQQPIYVTILANHNIALGETVIAADTLQPRLMQLSHGDRGERIFLRADKTVDYDTLMQVMNRLRGFGFFKIALVGAEGGKGQ